MANNNKNGSLLGFMIEIRMELCANDNSLRGTEQKQHGEIAWIVPVKAGSSTESEKHFSLCGHHMTT